jgi:hypothetical protein
MAPKDEKCSEGEYSHRLSPEDRWRLIVQFWSEFRIYGDYGAADPVEVNEIERLVTEELQRRTPDIGRAESLTFKALHLIDGNVEPTST